MSYRNYKHFDPFFGFDPAEIFLSLQNPRTMWQHLAKYLCFQKDIVNARGDEGELLAVDIMLHARESLQQDPDYQKHNLKQFWDSNLL